MNKSDEQMIAEIKHWLEKAVIGLNLCPFAKAVHVKEQILYVVSNAQNEEELLADLLEELQLLYDADSEKLETSLLIHPYVLTNFADYNIAVDWAGEKCFRGAKKVIAPNITLKAAAD